MSLLITMLPLYLFGNLHCIGMCGPIVMMLGQHRYRYLYFLGRVLSFSLAGLIAGEIGAVSQLILKPYHISALISFFFGMIILFIGANHLFGWQYPGQRWLFKHTAPLNNRLATLLLRDRGSTTFLFGLFTVLLPCGQTLLVFSACALFGDPLVGLMNGFVFALLTSPSLVLAMHAHTLLKSLKQHYNTVIGLSAVAIGILACCRGFAEMEIIPHWILNPQSAAHYHIVIF